MGLPLETKNTQNHENRRLGLSESLHMQNCSLRGCIRPRPHPSAGLSGIRFSITRMGSVTFKIVSRKHYIEELRMLYAYSVPICVVSNCFSREELQKKKKKKKKKKKQQQKHTQNLK